MKKLLYIALAVAAISCSKEKPIIDNTPAEEPQDGMITVTFSASVNETKATVSDAGAFTWKTGDRIAVYDENSHKFYPFDLSSGNGENTATFTGQFDAADYKFTKAYYPGNPFDFSSTYENAETVTIPSLATHGPSNGLIPLFGEVTGAGTLSFDYLTAIVKVSVDRIPRNTQYAVLKATNNIAGTFDVNSKTITSNGSKEIALSTNGVTGPQTFIFPVPAGENAVTFELRDGLHGAVLFTTGSDKAKTVTFKAPSLYYNNVTVPVCVYVNYTEPWVDGQTPYIYFRGNEDESAGYDINWPGSVIPTSGDWDVSHLAIGYRKVAYDLASVNTNSSTKATLVVHINWENYLSGEPYGDLYRVEVPLVDITNDLFIMVRPVYSQATSKIYFRNWSTNGWITKVWAGYTDDFGGASITDAWPGTLLSSMSSEWLGRSQYPYITADSGKWIKFKGNNKPEGNGENPNDKFIEVKNNKNTLVTLRDDDNTTCFDFGIAEVIFN